MINEDNFISVSGYSSFDSFNLASDSTFKWKTNNISLKWGHNFDQITSSQLVLASSNYSSELLNKDEIQGFRYQNGLNNSNLAYSFESKFSDKHQLFYGLEANYSIINPGKSENTTEFSSAQEFDIINPKALETALYAHYDWDITDRFAVSGGIRYSQFYRLGSGTIYKFDYNITDSYFPDLLDTLHYGNNELIDFQHGLEPRVSMRYKLDDLTSIKASYYRTNQYLHLISNTTSSSPLDYWLAGGPNLKQQIGDQYSIGFFRNLKENKYEFSVEGFYRETQNAIDYIEGADIKLTETIEGMLIQGEGVAYGAEVLARKNTGRLSGWFSYTYSRSLRRFNSQFDVLTVNKGELYPSQYDQPHNLSAILNFRATRTLFLSANFSYATGRPITIPVSKYFYDAYLSVLNYSERNEYRVPDYHRLDVSATLKGDNPSKRYQGEWVLSIFNVYGRNNAYAIYFNQYGRAKKVSIIGNMFPSLSYNFKF